MIPFRQIRVALSLVASIICFVGSSGQLKADPKGIELLPNGCLSFLNEAEFCPAEIGLDCQLQLDHQTNINFHKCAKSTSSNAIEGVFISSMIEAEHGSQTAQAHCEGLGNEDLSTRFGDVDISQDMPVGLCQVTEKIEFPKLTGSNRRFDLKSAPGFFQACVYLKGSKPLHLTACSGALGQSSVDDVLTRLENFLRTSDAFLSFEGFPR